VRIFEALDLVPKMRDAIFGVGADFLQRGQLVDELSRIQPKEIIANDGLFLQSALTKTLAASYYLQNYGGWAFELSDCEARLKRQFKVLSLNGLGCENMTLGVCAAGAAV